MKILCKGVGATGVIALGGSVARNSLTWAMEESPNLGIVSKLETTHWWSYRQAMGQSVCQAELENQFS